MNQIAFALGLLASFTSLAGAQSLGNGRASSPSRVEGATSVAPAGTTSPLRLLYRVSGVLDRSTPDVATVVNCTSFSNVAENVRILIYNYDGGLVKDLTETFYARRTVAFSTRFTAAYYDDFNLATGTVNQGFALIQATTNNIMCTASIVNATASDIQGVDLRMQRFNPPSGSTE